MEEEGGRLSKVVFKFPPPPHRPPLFPLLFSFLFFFFLV